MCPFLMVLLGLIGLVYLIAASRLVGFSEKAEINMRGALARDGSRHDRTSSAPLERSRSNLSDSLSGSNLSETLAGLKLDG